MGSPLPIKVQADLKGDAACSYASFALHHYIWGLWRSNMAETRVKKESTAPKTPAAKFWLAGKGVGHLRFSHLFLFEIAIGVARHVAGADYSFYFSDKPLYSNWNLKDGNAEPIMF